MPDGIRFLTYLRSRLAFFYVAQFGHLGIVLPFLAPWLQARGFGPVGIGVLMALPAMAKMIAPWTWGRWADSSGRRRELMVLASLVAALSLAGVALSESVWLMALLIAVYGFSRAPILPFVEATVLERSEYHHFPYGPIRLWGSLAFIAVSSMYGVLRAGLTPDAGLWIAASLLAAASLMALLVFPVPLDVDSLRRPEEAVHPERQRRERAELLCLFASCALMQTSHGAYYTFYSIRLEELGYGGAAIGTLWALAVIAEVAILTRLDPVVDRFGSRAVMRVCLVVAAVRWIVIGSSSSPGWLALGQLLHAATYAAFHVAAIRQVFRLYGLRKRTRGQAMYSGMTYGLGMFAGSLLAGWLARDLGVKPLFYISAAIALAAIPFTVRIRTN